MQTSSIGSFQFDQIPPGHYALTFGPELDERLDGEPRPRLRVDLQEDIYGYILGVGCPPGSQREHPRVTPIVDP